MPASTNPLSFAPATTRAAIANPDLMDETSNHDLMLAVRAGELSRLGDLFERHHGPLFGFLARLTRDPDGAEDLVQTTYLAAIENARAWNEQRPFLPWLSGILANRARRANRRKSPPKRDRRTRHTIQ